MRHDKGDRKTEAEERAGNDIWRSSDTLRVREESRGFEVFETDTSLRSEFETNAENFEYLLPHLIHVERSPSLESSSCTSMTLELLDW